MAHGLKAPRAGVGTKLREEAAFGQSVTSAARFRVTIAVPAPDAGVGFLIREFIAVDRAAVARRSIRDRRECCPGVRRRRKACPGPRVGAVTSRDRSQSCRRVANRATPERHLSTAERD